MTHTEALCLVIAHSPAALNAATKALQAIQSQSTVASKRVIGAIKIALSDGDATFSPDDKRALGEVLADITRPVTRDMDLRIRVSAVEKAQAERAAVAAGLALSAYVRIKLGLSEEHS